MAEYIDLDTPLELKVVHGNTLRPHTSTLRELLDINHIPYATADVAPVVLCRDCKHNAGKKIWLDHEETADCTNGHGYPPLDWFCADGVKREES